MRVKEPNATDKYVGSCLRMRRLAIGLSQEALADQLGITFQQVQKYEKGVNRISASRLHALSQILDVPVAFFFEGGPEVAPTSRTREKKPSPTSNTAFLGTRQGHRLAKAFMRIKNASLRHLLVRIIEKIVEVADS